MKKKRFSVEQIVGVLKQAEVGVPVAEVIRKAGISEQTFYRWKKQYVGLESDQVREMKQLQDENSRLKQLVAELSLDKSKRHFEAAPAVSAFRSKLEQRMKLAPGACIGTRGGWGSLSSAPFVDG